MQEQRVVQQSNTTQHITRRQCVLRDETADTKSTGGQVNDVFTQVITSCADTPVNRWTSERCLHTSDYIMHWYTCQQVDKWTMSSHKWLHWYTCQLHRSSTTYLTSHSACHATFITQRPSVLQLEILPSVSSVKLQHYGTSEMTIITKLYLIILQAPQNTLQITSKAQA